MTWFIIIIIHASICYIFITGLIQSFLIKEKSNSKENKERQITRDYNAGKVKQGNSVTQKRKKNEGNDNVFSIFG